MPYRPGDTVGRYEVIREVGSGGMGTVYEAHDPRLERSVALKFPSNGIPEGSPERKRFVNEARAASSLDHDNVGVVYDVGETETGDLYIVMAYYEGLTVRQRLAGGPIPWKEAVNTAAQAAAGLHYAHERGIIHRDIKPENLLITEEARLKILDFGVARIEWGTHDTPTGAVVGTPGYICPEHLRGAPMDRRSDIWSLGVVLHEMLTGSNPFDGPHIWAIQYKILNEEPEPPSRIVPDIPPALDEIIARCLRKDPSERYADAGQVATALERLDPLWPVIGERTFDLLIRVAAVVIAGVLAIYAGIEVARYFRGPSIRSVALLPFSTSDDDADRLAKGLTYVLAGRLAEIDDPGSEFAVLPAGEISERMPPSDVHERYGVKWVIDGALQVEGSTTRLTFLLIDAQHKQTVGSREVNIETAGGMLLQDEAFPALVSLLGLNDARLGGGAGEGLVNAEANTLYLRAMGHLKDLQSDSDVDAAIRLLRSAIVLDSTEAVAYAALGEAYVARYRRSKDPEAARQAMWSIAKAVSLGGDLVPVLAGVAALQSELGAHEAALETLERAAEIVPQNAELRRQKGIVLRRLGRLEASETALRDAAKRNPHYWRIHLNLGNTLKDAGRTKEAIRTYERGLAIAPMNLMLLGNLAATQYERAEIDEAETSLERIVGIDERNATALKNLATIRFYRGDYTAAAALYARSLAEEPENYVTCGFLADALLLAGTDSARTHALATYRRAIDLARTHLPIVRDSSDVLSSIATYQVRLGQVDSAATLLDRATRAVDIWSLGPDWRFGYGEVYLQVGQRNLAVELVASALRDGYGLVQTRNSPWLRAIRDDPAIRRAISDYGKGN